MSSTSKSKLKLKSKSYTTKTRNWLEIPSDLMVNILQRLSVFDILENAQKVCIPWREICKDPAMWRRINMDRFYDSRGKRVFRDMCKHAVDRSQGQLLHLTMIGCCDFQLLAHVTDRSSRIRRLEIISSSDVMYESWSIFLKELPLLEELSLVRTIFLPNHIETAGRFCPLLKTLKLNHQLFRSLVVYNKISLAVGKNLPGLTHLELIGNTMDNIGLEAILDGCSHLQSLDLRRCRNVNLIRDIEKRCSQQIKFLKLPHDSFEGCPHALYFSAIFDCDPDRYDDYDYYDYTKYHNEDELSEDMACLYVFG